MKAKGIVLSLMASTLINLPSSFAQEYQNSTELTEAKKSKLEFYPVKLSKTQIKGGLILNGKSYISLTKKSALTIDNFKFQSLSGDKLSINLVLSDKENKALSQLTKKYQNTKLAIVLNNKVLMAPSINKIIGEGSLELSTSDVKMVEELLVELKKV